MPEAADPDEVAESTILAGRLHLRQPVRGHRAGTDAVLLAATAGTPSGLLVDAGAGVGTVGLAVALRSPGLQVTLVEQDPLTASLARQNISLNQLEGRVRVIETDLLSAGARRGAGLPDGEADVVVSNPPWLAPGRARLSPNARRAAAHAQADGVQGLNDWMRALGALIRPGGRMVLIHRADALEELLEACRNRFGALAIRPVHPRADEPAHRILVQGIKGSRAPLMLLPALILHEADGTFTPVAEALHRGEALLA